MNERMKKLKDILVKVWPIILVLIIFLVIIIYCGLNTMTFSDDLRYSFPGKTRITSVKQVISSQIYDYKTINGRFLVHLVLQFVLIYGRNLFAVINAIVLSLTVFIASLIVYEIIKRQDKYFNLQKNILNITIFVMLLLMIMYNYKCYIYWAAASVNYVWVCLYCLLVFYYYLKNKFNTNVIFNTLLFFLLGNLQENSLVFGIILYIFMVINDIIDKKFNYKKLFYIIPIALGALILLGSPGQVSRSNQYSEWYNVQFIKRLFISVPYLCKEILKLNTKYNILPYVYITSIIFNLIKNRKFYKYYILKILSITILVICVYIFKFSQYAYFSLMVGIFLIEFTNYIKSKNYNMLMLMIGMYAVSMSMCITPLYYSLRPNYYIYIYIIISSVTNYIEIFKDTVKFKKYACLVISILLVLNLYFEIKIYTCIGNIQNKRELQIKEFNNTKEKVLVLNKVPKKYSIFQFECNAIYNEYYWAKKYFYLYYNINTNVKIISNY